MPPTPSHPPEFSPRAEKLSALTDLLGPETMARLRTRNTGFDSGAGGGSPIDADRVAWQRNRLLARLRADLPTKGKAPISPAKSVGAERRTARIEAHISNGLRIEDLADEHPAVIAQVLKSLGRADRIAALRALPGQTARAAIQRLKADAQGSAR